MRYSDQPDDEARRRQLLELRRRNTARLVRDGFTRPGVEGALPVLAFDGHDGGDGRPGAGADFLAIDERIVVPAERVDDVRRVLGDHVGEVSPLAVESFVAIQLRDLGVIEALRRLGEAEPLLRATPQHLTFCAFRAHGQEGEDPEPVPRTQVRVKADVEEWLGEGVTVAVVDTGMASTALSDPFLAGITVAEQDIDVLQQRETRVAPDGSLFHDLEAGHGTMVAAVVREVAPASTIEVVRALNPDGIATEDEIARAIDEAVSQRQADIILLALGGFSDRDLPPPVIEDAIRRVPADVAIVAAAGNFFDDRPVWPGAIRRVVSVAALDQRGNDDTPVVPRLAWYSSFGWWVDMAAPGAWATPFVEGFENPDRETDGAPDHFKGFAEASGSSLAAAAVAGALAAELSKLRRSARATTPIGARSALGPLLERTGNVRLPQGTMAIDVWDGQ